MAVSFRGRRLTFRFLGGPILLREEPLKFANIKNQMSRTAIWPNESAFDETSQGYLRDANEFSGWF